MNLSLNHGVPSNRSARRLFFLVLLAGLTVPVLECGKVHKTGMNPGTASTIRVVSSNNSVVLTTATAEFQFLSSGYLQASLLRDGSRSTLDDFQVAADSDYVESSARQIRNFQFDLSHIAISDTSDGSGGRGERVEIIGKSADLPDLQETISLEAYDELPNVVVTSVTYKNLGATAIMLDQIVSQSHVLNAALSEPNAATYSMWSFHGSSEAWGKDDVSQITKNFDRKNPMQAVMHNDENQTGGGLPIVAFWTRSTGEAVGSAETVPLRMAIPVHTADDGRVHVSIVSDEHTQLQPGQVYAAPRTFLAVFRGDFYEPLSLYSKLLQQRGWSLAKQTDADYQANWCGWGYGMDFTAKQMLGTIPKLKEFGIRWATLDARWWGARGDWQPRQDTLPGDEIKRVVHAFHDAGIKMTLWWIPVVAEDGRGKDILDHRQYTLSNVVREHPDWLILDPQGKPARATADLAALCPAVPEVQAYTRDLTRRFIHDWDFDGSKLDFSYTVPACYNPKHHHKSPNDSIAAMADVYRIVLETTRSLKPESVTQACPCGTPPSLAWLPFIDQAVTADPVGARQVRERTKMYKALLGPNAAIYGDHVELTDVQFKNTLQEIDKGQDFASEVGVGAVLGTKFTWPAYGPKLKDVELTPGKEAHWKKWVEIYNAKMLSKGTFMNLYTYGYDFPEAYAIEKGGSMYYAFYTEKGSPWSGQVELRGLKPGHYQLTDYESGKPMGFIDSENPRIPVAFSEHLLLEARPL
jgi:alpha-galactosidase